MADTRPDLDADWFSSHDLGDLSRYATEVSGSAPSGFAQRGAFAVGNGRIFGLLGMVDPVNTLHEVVGPIYRMEGRFFGDLVIDLEQQGQPVQSQASWVARPRGTALAVTRSDGGGMSFYTIDFAPLPADRAEAEAPPVWVRVLVLRATDGAAHDVRAVFQPRQSVQAVDGGFAEVLDSGRSLVVRGVELPLRDQSLELSVPAGGEVVASVVLATAESLTGAEALAAEAAAADLELWLDDTLRWWRDFSAQGMQLEVEGAPRITDLYDGMRVGIRVQQTPEGGVSPMSRYTGVWLRDTIGPTRFYLRAGLAEQARAAVDYLYLCHIDRGDFGNACASGLTEDDVGDAPDWSALGPLSGRTAAEGPNYVPLMYRELAEWTGAWELVDERWDYLSRSVLAQQIDDQGRQTWSGDETFRAAMEAALGYPLEYPWTELAWSANSSMLLAGAADFMVEAAEELGRDPAPFEARAALARQALSQTYLQPEGYYAPFVFHTAGSDNSAGQVETRPFEDVTLKALWIPVLSADDPLALSNLARLREQAGRGDGTLQSPADPSFKVLMEVEDGIATGMLPGYYLSNLTALGDPEAGAAFDALDRYAGSSGQYAEDIVYDDLSALHLFYDDTGAIGDISARYRPWEGGVNLDAGLSYLLGLEPIEGGLRLRPHLPPGQHTLRADHVQLGEARLSLSLRDLGPTHELVVSSEADVAFELLLELPSASGRRLAAGERLATFRTTLAPAETQRFRVVAPR